ncbi:4Fe-4S binding protein [Desulfobacula phenolica]|uniref:4Fe-4S dicluster domain-containing protein n=1 Tax=Desulfobacula phenolica TaxID=90732 RepID=A0A1H2HTU0_9BACT|nr:4Fe-4S binding protein [Desulfobacula phenolica]SDU35330.1 4Fe-4S dicluster domain-containing protein [Desulfobacula phenolica]
MNKITQNIRTLAKQLLEEKTVDSVIGFQQASLAHMTRPFMAKTIEDAQELVFNCNCRMNLTNYLSGLKNKVGIVVKGCDSRNLVTQLIENRINRDQVYIIGVPCTGLADKTKLLNTAKGLDIVSVEDDDDTIVIKTDNCSMSIEKEEILQDNCRTCIRHNPVIHDVLAGPAVPESEIQDRFKDVEKIEALNPDDKKAFFTDLLDTCIRCYACRDACPLCYCPTCFVDESRPQWVGKTTDPVDTRTYHLVRAFHDAGRCTDCGACEAACPMNIPIRVFTRKTIKDCVQYFGVEAGMDETLRPALDKFSLEDPQPFIR